MPDTTSFIVHRSAQGERLRAVLSLHVLQTLNHEGIEALNSMGIFSLSDLLHYAPVHRARILREVARGHIAHDMDLKTLLRDDFVSPDTAAIAAAPSEVVDGIGPSIAETLRTRFNVRTVSDLAEFAPFKEAESLMNGSEESFSEPESAPDELLPRMVGTVSSVFRYSSFISDREFLLHNYQLTNAPVSGAILPFVNAFNVTQLEGVPRVTCGYIALHRQRWINLGTQLGEVVHSLALAPGESRNIAIVDWRSRHVTRRSDATESAEALVADAIHSRALDEVARGVAQEHQSGRTTAMAATGVAGLGAVASAAAVGAAAGGIAGASTGSLAGGIGGAALGTAITSESGGWGFIPGLFLGAAAGAAVFGATGAMGGAVIGGAAGGIGFIMSESHGLRDVIANDRQNIADVTAQKSSLVRSLRATIVVEDTQSQQTDARTFNITNYNHSHSLNLTYYEILHRYAVELRTERLEPFVVLPFSPVDFTQQLIVDYWDILKPGFTNRSLVDAFDAVLGTDGVLDLPPDPVSTVPSRITRLRLDVRRDFFSQAPTVRFRMHDDSTKDLEQMSGEVINGTPIDHWKLGDGQAVDTANIRKLELVFPGGPRPDANYEVIAVEIEVSAENPPRTARIPNWSVARTSVGKQVVGNELVRELDFDVRGKLGQGEAAVTDSRATIDRVVHFVQARKYYFTRVLFAGMEPEQLADVIATLRFRDGGQQIPITAICDPAPFAITSRGVLLRLKQTEDAAAAVPPVGEYARDLADWFNSQKETQRVTTSEVFLPTSGIFGEAILGRSNASEKIDLTRYWNWQDSPIPNAAPQIQPVNAAGQPQTPLDTTPYMPANVLNVMQPTALPDPTGMAGILGAIQNGNMFRDMSKSEQLTGLMGTLANTAAQAATSAGSLAGEAHAKALESAVALSSKVADMVQQMMHDISSKLPQIENVTHEGGRINQEQKKADAPKQEKPKQDPPATTPPTNTGPQQPQPQQPQPQHPVPRPQYDRTLHPDLLQRRNEGIASVFGNRGLPRADTVREGMVEGSTLIRGFPVNSDQLKDEQKGALAQLAMLLNSSDQARTYIEGHASRTGPEPENITQSEFRADTVRQWLTTEGGVQFSKVNNILGIGSAFPPGRDSEGAEDDTNRSVLIYYSIPQSAASVTVDAPLPVIANEEKEWKARVGLGLAAGIMPAFGGIGGTAGIVLLSDAATPAGETPTYYPFIFVNLAFAKVLADSEGTNVGVEVGNDWFKGKAETKVSIWKMIWNALPYVQAQGSLSDKPFSVLAGVAGARTSHALADFDGTSCEIVLDRTGTLTEQSSFELRLPDLGLTTGKYGTTTIGGTGIGAESSSGYLLAMPQWIRDLIPESVEERFHLG